MKPADLQIYDYVLFDKQIYQIKNGTDIDRAERYEPVLLTDNILNYNFSYDWIVNIYDVLKLGIAERERPYICPTEYGDSMLCKCKYLHQLQHVLRMFGYVDSANYFSFIEDNFKWCSYGQMFMTDKDELVFFMEPHENEHRRTVGYLFLKLCDDGMQIVPYNTDGTLKRHSDDSIGNIRGYYECDGVYDEKFGHVINALKEIVNSRDVVNNFTVDFYKYLIKNYMWYFE